MVQITGSTVLNRALTTSADRTKRIPAVDGLRGVLAVVVLSWHAFGPLGAPWLLLPADAAVGFFFLLSGYVLTRGWNRQLGVFLVRRFARLWPVFAICLGTGYLIAGVQPVWSEFAWYPLIGADTKPSIDPPVWSLFIEAWTMPLMPLIVWVAAASAIRVALAIVVVGTIGFVAHATVFGPVLLVTPLFIGGAYLAPLTYRSRIFESTIPQWLGRISYSLYLTHWLVLRLATQAFGVWGAIAALPVVFAVAWLVWWGVERPSIAASHTIGKAVGRVFGCLSRGDGGAK